MHNEDHYHTIFRDSFQGGKGLQGPGDDCARISPPRGDRLVWTTDQLVEGVHVEQGLAAPKMARKLLRRTLSDLAAAGARPWALTWTVAAPAKRGRRWMTGLAKAFLEEAGQFGCSVVGGDLSEAPCVVLSCSALGRMGSLRPPGRAGAKPGDWLLVTGRLGGAVRSGRHLLPEPRLAEGRLLAARYRAHAMMDLSDGLATDLPRMLAASGIGATLELDALPLAHPLKHDSAGWRSGVTDGEDYELLAALSPRQARRALEDRLLRRTGLHVVGTCGSAEEGLVWQAFGKVRAAPGKGWQHSWGKE